MKGAIRLHRGRFVGFAVPMALFWFAWPAPTSSKEEVSARCVFAIMMTVLVVASLRWQSADGARPPLPLQLVRALAIGCVLAFVGVILWLAIEAR